MYGVNLPKSRNLTEETQPPTYLQDYHCDLIKVNTHSTNTYQHVIFIILFNIFFSYNNLSTNQKCFNLKLSSIIEVLVTPKLFLIPIKNMSFNMNFDL